MQLNKEASTSADSWGSQRTPFGALRSLCRNSDRNCHLERSEWLSLAKAIAQSKGPYWASAALQTREFWPESVPGRWLECLAVLLVRQAEWGSFDFAQEDIGRQTSFIFFVLRH